MLLSEASRVFDWKLNFGAIALMWRGGCIIRSRFLGEIKKAFDKNPHLENLLLDDFFKKAVSDAQVCFFRLRNMNSSIYLGIMACCCICRSHFWNSRTRLQLCLSFLWWISSTCWSCKSHSSSAWLFWGTYLSTS